MDNPSSLNSSSVGNRSTPTYSSPGRGPSSLSTNSSPSLGLSFLGLSQDRSSSIIVPNHLKPLIWNRGYKKYLRCPDIVDERAHKKAFDAFVTLYQSTPFYLETVQNARLRPITFNSSKRCTEMWKSYSECISLEDGMPMVICRRCSAVLKHPVPGNHGNNTLKSHLESVGCTSKKRSALSPMKRAEHINVAILRVSFAKQISVTKVCDL